MQSTKNPFTIFTKVEKFWKCDANNGTLPGPNAYKERISWRRGPDLRLAGVLRARAAVPSPEIGHRGCAGEVTSGTGKMAELGIIFSNVTRCEPARSFDRNRAVPFWVKEPICR